MNGITPTVILFCVGVVFASGGAFWAIDSVENRVTKVEDRVEKEVILRPEFEAVVKRVEQAQETVKDDVKDIKNIIQGHYEENH